MRRRGRLLEAMVVPANHLIGVRTRGAGTVGANSCARRDRAYIVSPRSDHETVTESRSRRPEVLEHGDRPARDKIPPAGPMKHRDINPRARLVKAPRIGCLARQGLTVGLVQRSEELLGQGVQRKPPEPLAARQRPIRLYLFSREWPGVVSVAATYIKRHRGSPGKVNRLIDAACLMKHRERNAAHEARFQGRRVGGQRTESCMAVIGISPGTHTTIGPGQRRRPFDGIKAVCIFLCAVSRVVAPDEFAIGRVPAPEILHHDDVPGSSDGRSDCVVVVAKGLSLFAVRRAAHEHWPAVVTCGPKDIRAQNDTVAHRGRHVAFDLD